MAMINWDENKNRANIEKHGIEIGAALNGIVFVVHTINELSDGDELYWDHLGSVCNVSRKESI